jgi:hypothetical protein
VSLADYLVQSAKVTVADGKATKHHATLEANFGRLEVSSSPAGAQITLDGEATGQVTPHVFERVRAGVVEVGLGLEGYGDRVVRPKVQRGGRVTVSESLAAKLGTLSILVADSEGQPCEATVSLDGKAQPGTTPMRLDLPARSYELKVDCAGVGARENVVVAHNKKTAVELTAMDDTALKAQRAAAQRLDKGHKIFAGIMFGTAGALTAAGVVRRVNTGWAGEQAASAQSALAYQFAVENIHEGNVQTGGLIGAAVASTTAGLLAAVVSGARAKHQRKLQERHDALRRQLDDGSGR